MCSGDDAAAQRDEVEVLQSIFGEDVAGDSGQMSAGFRGTHVLRLPMAAPAPIQVAAGARHVTVSQLPPVTLRVAFPDNYPSSVAPRFHLDAPFLSLGTLCAIADKLDGMFCSGEPVVFEWAQYLLGDAWDNFVPSECTLLGECSGEQNAGSREADTVGAATIYITEDMGTDLRSDRRIARRPWTSRELLRYLTENADRADQAELENGFYKCCCCWESKSGRECIMLRVCRHVSCKSCLDGFWTARINDGQVSQDNIVCAEADCNGAASDAEIRAAVSAETREKYERFLLSQTLNKLGDVIMCARPGCERIASRDASEPGFGWCAYCGYSFCTLCTRLWHGGTPCLDVENVEGQAHIAEEDVPEMAARYQCGDKETQAEMLKQFGAENIALLQTACFMFDMGGRRCPECKAYVIKNGGCAHMTCSMCRCEFCWHCLEVVGSGIGHWDMGPFGCRLFDQDQSLNGVWGWLYNPDDD